MHPLICAHCRQLSALLLDAPEFSLQCKRSETKNHIKKQSENNLSSWKKAIGKTKRKVYILYIML